MGPTATRRLTVACVAALALLANADLPERRVALDLFYKRWKDELGPLFQQKAIFDCD